VTLSVFVVEFFCGRQMRVIHRRKPTLLHLRPVAPRTNPTAPIPDGAQLHQLLFSKQRSGGERIQMVGALNHATAAAEIALDRVMAPPQLLCDFATGYALETCLDCPTPDLIGWTYAPHLTPLKRKYGSRQVGFRAKSHLAPNQDAVINKNDCR